MAKEKDTHINMDNSLISPGNDRKPSLWLLWAYALGLMVMPDNLALSGQFAGQLGIFAPLILAASVLIYFRYANSFANLYEISPNAGGKDFDGHKHIGTLLVYYPLVVRILATIFLATGLTVSSGFVFNEVFVYWFPNFAFAFILLAALVGLQLLGKSYRKKAQIFFVGTVLLGLSVIIVVGLTTSLFQDMVQINSEQPMGISGLFLPLLLLLGFDMALNLEDNSSSPSPANIKSFKIAIAIFAGFMIFWVMTALLHVEGRRLAGTSIAHLIIAREIGGQVGRVVMGLMIIAGTCAALNALFESVAGLARTLSQHRMLPQMHFLPKAMVLGMAVIAAVLMANGLAGEELLEVLIRAVLLLWLGQYGLVVVHLMLQPAATSGSKNGRSHGQNMFKLMLTAIVTFGAILVLVLTDEQPMLILIIMILSVLAMFIFGAINRLYLRRQRQFRKELSGKEVIMLKKYRISILTFLALVGVAGLTATPIIAAGDVGVMNKDELKAFLGNDDVVILDVRTGRDWSSSEFKIQGAQRVKAKKIDKWSANLSKDKKLVLYCA